MPPPAARLFRPVLWGLGIAAAAAAIACLHAGQVWWAKRVAVRWEAEGAKHGLVNFATDIVPHLNMEGGCVRYVERWRSVPWFGSWSRSEGYVPKRVWSEYLRRVTGQDLGEDPDAWERWLGAHPGLAWDPARRKLVESER